MPDQLSKKPRLPAHSNVSPEVNLLSMYERYTVAEANIVEQQRWLDNERKRRDELHNALTVEVVKGGAVTFVDTETDCPAEHMVTLCVSREGVLNIIMSHTIGERTDTEEASE